MYRFDINNNLVTISSSILKYFTNTCFNNTNKYLDEILSKKKYDKIVLMLMDGMSSFIMDKHLSENDYLKRHVKFQTDAIFPPTTVACTNALLSGKYPSQNGNLGWRQYFKQYEQIIEMFTNRNSLTGEKLKLPLLSESLCGYESILDIIKNKANINTDSLYPSYIKTKGAKDEDDFFVIADKMMKNKGEHFYYMYYPSPDNLIHQFGVDDIRVKDFIKRINKRIHKLAKDNKDNLIILLADHGLVNTKSFYIYEHEDFALTLKTIPSLDARSCFFHVKNGMEKEFEALFNKYYGKFFVLKTKKEVLEEEIFGPKENYKLLESFIGEYLAISISEYGFSFEHDDLLAHHAGGLEEEYKINVMILNP